MYDQDLPTTRSGITPRWYEIDAVKFSFVLYKNEMLIKIKNILPHLDIIDYVYQIIFNYMIKNLPIYTNISYHHSHLWIIRSFHMYLCNARVEQHWAIKQKCPTRGQIIIIIFFLDQWLFLSDTCICILDTLCIWITMAD